MNTLNKLRSDNNKALVDNKANIIAQEINVVKRSNAINDKKKNFPLCSINSNKIEYLSEKSKIKEKFTVKVQKTEEISFIPQTQTISLSPNSRLCEEYGEQITQNLQKEDKNFIVGRFLEKHVEISPRTRARLIDWFVEIA